MRWVHRTWRAMGSTAEVVVLARDPEALADRAVARVAGLEAAWSRFDRASDLCALNDAAGDWHVVPDALWLAVVAAREAWAVTGGRFDPTVLGPLVALGYDATFTAVAPDGAMPPPARPAPGFGAVALDPDRRAVRLPAGAGLDLGGIGKGLAADLLADELTADAHSVCVSLGGDVAVRGPGPGDDAEWPIPVSGPDGEALGTFPLVDEALVQSTTAIRRWRRGGRCLHHIIDPSTGEPAAAGIVAAVVTGPRASLAEAVAKAAIVAGPDAGVTLVTDAGLDGWLFTEDHRCVTTDAVAADLERCGAR